MDKPNYLYYEVYGNTVDENNGSVQEFNFKCTNRELAHDIFEMFFSRGYETISFTVLGTMERLVL